VPNTGATLSYWPGKRAQKDLVLCFLRRLCRLIPLLACYHVGKEIVDILRRQDAAPGRHVVLAISNRIDEPGSPVGRKSAQVEVATAWIDHMLAMTLRAIPLVERCAGLDLFWRESR